MKGSGSGVQSKHQGNTASKVNNTLLPGWRYSPKTPGVSEGPTVSLPDPLAGAERNKAKSNMQNLAQESSRVSGRPSIHSSNRWRTRHTSCAGTQLKRQTISIVRSGG